MAKIRLVVHESTYTGSKSSIAKKAMFDYEIAEAMAEFTGAFDKAVVTQYVNTTKLTLFSKGRAVFEVEE